MQYLKERNCLIILQWFSIQVKFLRTLRIFDKDPAGQLQFGWLEAAYYLSQV